MSENKLKPCPFCGTMPYSSVESTGVRKIKRYIQCDNANCGAKITFEYETQNGFLRFNEVYKALNKAIETWNRRIDNE